jgi:hypothetical protein
MTVRRKGLIRLWVVLSVIWTLGASFYVFKDWSSTWSNIDAMAYQNCYGQYGLKPGQTTDQCLNEAGVNKSYFEREHTTALAWWSAALGISFVADLFVTGFLVGFYYVLRWVIRGFRNDTKSET